MFHQRLEIFVADIFAGIAQLTDGAVLCVRLREDCLDGCRKSCQVVRTGNENVLYSTISEAVEDTGPELGALILTAPHAEDVLSPLHVDADGDVDCFLDDLPLASNMVMDGIQKDYGVETFQRPLLPFLCNRQNLVRDSAGGRIRNVNAIDIVDVALNVAGRHSLGVHGENLLLDILADAGLVLLNKLGLKFPLAVTGDRNLNVAEAGAKILLAIPITVIVCALVPVVVLSVAERVFHFCFNVVLHILGNGFLEQIPDILHTAGVAFLQQFPDLCSTYLFFQTAFFSCENLPSNVSILHYLGGLHKI